MTAFIGGSSYAMARDIAEGLVLVSPMNLKKLNPSELKALTFELDRLLRDIRGEQPSLTDTAAIQKRNRKLSRLNQANVILNNIKSQQKR